MIFKEETPECVKDAEDHLSAEIKREKKEKIAVIGKQHLTQALPARAKKTSTVRSKRRMSKIVENKI